MGAVRFPPRFLAEEAAPGPAAPSLAASVATADLLVICQRGKTSKPVGPMLGALFPRSGKQIIAPIMGEDLT